MAGSFLPVSRADGAGCLRPVPYGADYHGDERQCAFFSGMMLGFGAWFCFLAKEILPAYYDENKIGYYAEGIFRIHVAGASLQQQQLGNRSAPP